MSKTHEKKHHKKIKDCSIIDTISNLSDKSKYHSDWNNKSKYLSDWNDKSKSHSDSNDKSKYRHDSNDKYRSDSKYHNHSDHKSKHHYDLNEKKEDRKCNNVRCGPQSQVSFCVPLSFDQELVVGTGGTGTTGGSLVPLSFNSINADKISGQLKLKFNSSLSMMAYKLYVFNAISPYNQITAAHLHLGSASQNGPVVIPLYEKDPTNVNGLLSEGVITNKDIINTNLSGFSIINSVNSLYNAITEEVIYANVHSTQFPAGIIRGQIYVNH